MSEDTASALALALEAAIKLDAPISSRLADYAAAQKQHAAPYSGAVDRLVERLEAVSAGAASPRIGDPMPEFLLPDERGQLTALSDLLRNGPLVVAFHRGHWCPFCRINAHALSQIDEQVRVRKGQIVAITPERGKYTMLHRSQASARYLMLSDIENAYALSLNLAVWIDDEVRQHLLGFGRNLNVYLGSEGWILPIPATFIVGTDGRVVARFVDPDHRHRMDLDAILDAIDSAN
jgi:peroxiredoxin